MKRTTISLDEDLFQKVRQEATRQGATLKSFINDVLRKAVTRKRAPQRFTLKWRPVKGLLKPGIDIADRDRLYDLMDGRR